MSIVNFSYIFSETLLDLFFLFYDIFIFTYVNVLVCMCAMCLQRPWSPELGIGSPRIGVTGNCEPPDEGAGI